MQKNTIFALLLAFCLTAGCMSGCGKEKVPEGEIIEKPTVLTHVYKGEDLALSDAYNISEYLGVKDNNFIFLGNYFKETEGATPEEYTYESYPVLCYLPIEGGEPTVEKIEGREWVNRMTLIDGGYMILDNSWDETTMQSSYNLEIVMDDGTVNRIENLASFFSGGNTEYFYLDQICQDGEGYVYLFAEQEIAVLKPDFTLDCSITLDNWVSNVDKDTEGTVYVGYWSYDEVSGTSGQVFAPIDRVNKTVGESIALPENIHADNFFFGPDYELYYYNSEGIFGYNTGDTDGTLLMDFENSDITGDLDLVKAVDENRFLLQYYDRISWDRKMGVFTKSADIDLSQIQVLELATASNPQDLATLVVEFNRNHTDARIVTTDYSWYNTEEDYNAGNTRLANDILNGLYKPDMICGYYHDSGYKAVLDKDLYLDLQPYLREDTKLPEDELLGCVTNTYQKDGKLFGLPMSIGINAVIANKSLVGDRSGWTVDELLTFIKGLPEGVEYMSGLTRDSAAYQLLGNDGYGIFMDMENGTCSFDSDTFITFLEYIKTLPEELPDDYYMTMNEDRYGPYKTGKTVAAGMSYHGINSFLEEKVYFGADNIAYVGTPTADGKGGVRLNGYEATFTILADTEHPDLCWSFIRDSILQTNAVDEVRGSHNLPMLRSSLEAMKEEFKDTTFVVHYDGGMSWGSSMYTEELDNGEVFQLTDADWKHIETFLDTIGAPLTSSALPADVQDILAEEMSAYLGGSKSAADCADMIQNRVSLYLAENS